MKIDKTISMETPSTSSELDDLEEALRSLDAELSELQTKDIGSTEKKLIEVIDMTSLTGFEGEARRIVMRRTRVPSGYSGSPSQLDPERRILGEHYLVGLVKEEDLPKEGEFFEVSQVVFDGYPDYTKVKTASPISGLKQVGNRYYFHSIEQPSSETQPEERIEWCVEIDPGN